MKAYINKIYSTRYFWLHLAQSDLKNRFRRSKLGILWSMANPLFLTAIMTVIFGTLFHSPMGEYAPYILSGLIVWDIVSSSFIGGSTVIIGSESYIRQVNHPITIYTLRWGIVTIATFCIALSSLVIWILFLEPIYILLGILTLPLTLIIYLALSWSITTFSSIVGTKYRDYPQIVALVIQAVWYCSSVFFRREMFTSSPGMEKLFYLNPINHLLDLIRQPFLYGKLPSLDNYLFSIGFVIVWVLIAWRLYRRAKNNIVFYL